MLVFKGSIDYTKVRIYNRHLFFCKNDTTVVAPWGYIYFPSGVYEEDFSQVSNHKKRLFIHEMAHVWQHQQGYNVFLNGIKLFLKGGYRQNRNMGAYCIDYQHVPPRTQLNQFNMEQQAELISFYFSLYCLNQTVCYGKIKFFLDQIMVEFVGNPNQKSLLPRATKIDKLL